jgi:hypothetical protein
MLRRAFMSPEKFFREYGQDLIAIDFVDFKFNEVISGYADDQPTIEALCESMLQWLDQFCPNSPYFVLTPSEYSGYLMGGPMMLSCIFTGDDQLKLTQQWRKDSKPLRYEIRSFSHSEWLAMLKATSCSQGDETPALPCRWWLINETLYAVGQNCNGHVLSIDDAEYRIRDEFPALKTLDLSHFPSGESCFDPRTNKYQMTIDAYVSMVWQPEQFVGNTEFEAKICRIFKLERSQCDFEIFEF